MGTRINLHVGWLGAKDVTSVLSAVLGEKITLPADSGADGSAVKDAASSAAGALNARLEAQGLSVGFIGNSQYDGHIEGTWLLGVGKTWGDWISHLRGLDGNTLDVADLEDAIQKAEALARAHKELPKPALHQLTVS